MIWYMVGVAMVFIVLYVALAYVAIGVIKSEQDRCDNALSEKYTAVEEKEAAYKERDMWKGAAARLAEENERLKREAET